MTKLEILEGTCSTEYRTYLELNLGHIEEYGEKPTLTYIGKSYDNLDLWDDGKEIYGRTPLKADNTSIHLKNNKTYEISTNGDLYVANCTAEEYMNYEEFMCWNAYIDII